MLYNVCSPGLLSFRDEHLIFCVELACLGAVLQLLFFLFAYLLVVCASDFPALLQPRIWAAKQRYWVPNPEE